VSRRARLIIAAAVAAISAIAIVVLGLQLASRGDGDAKLPLDLELRSAAAPFAGYREARIDFDGRCRRVAVANTEALRAQGLRGHTELGPYAGMLFVFDRDTRSAFTMAGVSQPLEIGWYTADGTRVGGAHMAACPDRTQEDCPVYGADRKYRVALETPGGSPSASGLAACS
jgi:uncharacterized membrane protein (UPF0127 family)